MESALAWIGKLAEWIGQWIPRWVIINPTHGGIKYTGFMIPLSYRRSCARALTAIGYDCGHFDGAMRVTPLPPGIHFYWPATTSYDHYPTVLQVDDLRSQTVVTADEPERTIVVGGMISYRVHDIEKLLAHSYNAMKLIRDVAMTAIHNVCSKATWAELKEGQRRGTLDTKLRNEARKQLEEFGVTVVKVQLTDLAPTRVYKVMQSTSKDDE